jgi:hypothetical protein
VSSVYDDASNCGGVSHSPVADCRKGGRSLVQGAGVAKVVPAQEYEERNTRHLSVVDGGVRRRTLRRTGLLVGCVLDAHCEWTNHLARLSTSCFPRSMEVDEVDMTTTA